MCPFLGIKRSLASLLTGTGGHGSERHRAPESLAEVTSEDAILCGGRGASARLKRSAGSTVRCRSRSRVRAAALPNSIPGSAGARVVAELLRAESRRDARLHVRTEPPPLKTKRIEKVPGCRRTDGRGVGRPDVAGARGAGSR